MLSVEVFDEINAAAIDSESANAGRFLPANKIWLIKHALPYSRQNIIGHASTGTALIQFWDRLVKYKYL